MLSDKGGNVKTKLFSRKPFFVRAKQMTPDNLAEIAEWCGGTLASKDVRGSKIQYVTVPVIRPRNPREQEAYIGDWVVAAGTGFKVYSNRAFIRDFDPVNVEDLQTAGMSDEQIAREMAKTREACGGVRPEMKPGEAAISRFQFQTGLELEYNTKRRA